ncbi:DNA repair protein RadC [Staphylococcus warneri]|uniref:RadC family protein n=1 Tax=Staphylococcus warneri TaxID=1292 RepID=UPI000D8ADF76|nr:DNA repair protein RadC [Staphylococcus warneri]PXX85363.1 hypothetical protein DLY76_04880 [Staphylococcus warneri]QJX55904.1 DNA repair protein RadC [Staphylococcus warneri]
MRIKEMANSEKPRERLVSNGAASLSNSELLAILINTGRKGCSSIEIANELLSGINTLKELKKFSINDLIKVKGIGYHKAITLKAAFEIGERINSVSQQEVIKITCPADVADLMMSKLKDLQQEHFYVLLLNSKNIVIKQKCVFVGTLNSSIIHPREIFNVAIKESCNSMIVVHNHPSGDLTPSEEDINTTIRLRDCGMILGINVLDHIIIGDNQFTSLVECGYFDNE